MRERLVVIGGTGFVGRHLARRLALLDIEARFVVHRAAPDWNTEGSVALIPCQLDNQSSMRQVLDGATRVVSLLRPDGTGDRLRTLEALMPVIAATAPAGLVHASSIDVYGDAQGAVLTETSVPRPNSDYAREHLAIERLFLDFPQATILRIAAVFGDGGANVVGFAREVATRSSGMLLMRRLLYGARLMHLVSVATVVSAIVHLLVQRVDASPPLLILSDDQDERNNFAYMQDTLLSGFGRRGMTWLPTVPFPVLETLLRLRGKSFHDVRRRYLTAYPEVLTHARADFGAELAQYASILARSPQ